MGYIKGNYRKTIFRSEQGYVIGLFKVRETDIESMNEYINKSITFTGYFNDLNEDDIYVMHGVETIHPKFGFQFNVKEYEREKPVGKDGVIEFLASPLFPLIGVSFAKSIVETLGENALEKILLEPESLNMVPKMTPKKYETIYNNLIKYEESHQVIVYLTELGFNMKDSLAIYNKYRNETISKVETDIYQLIYDMIEITFLKVDDLAQKLVTEKDDERRVKAGIIYTMENLTFQKGDTYLAIEEIYNRTMANLKIEIDHELFFQFIDELINMQKIVVEEERYYLKSIYDAEQNIVNKMCILTNKEPTKYKKMAKYISNSEDINAIKYDDTQKRAIEKALENNVLIITGGPGTGKTTIVKAIVEIYQNHFKLDDDELIEALALLAPTGRASKRLSEATNLPAYTIHRFLKWNKETNTFAVNEHNKDGSHLIIVDEVSMLDINLFDNLFKGLTDNIKLILVGDYNQLPSVGPGQILKDLIDSEVVDTVKLKLLYRQTEDSYIPALAQEIKNNDLNPDFSNPHSDYNFIECNTNQIKPALQKICEKIIEKKYEIKKIQIMAPIYHGINGIDNLNSLFQSIFNPPDESKNEIVIGDVTFRENDKVLQLVNMPDMNVYNGDIGIIKEIIGSKKGEICIDFDGSIVKYTQKDLQKIKHGYIISIHKSQGSEFDTVIMPICPTYQRMLYRKLIYTGVTRAKKKLIIVGDKMAFSYAVSNNHEYMRKTMLKEKLISKVYNSIKNS